MRRMSSRLRGESGAGVVEAVVAITLLSVVLGAMISVLIQQQRFYLVANDAANTTSLVERLETVMLGELMPLSAGGGDVVYASADSLVVRVFRGVFSICSMAGADDNEWWVRPLTKVRPVGVDSLLVFSEGTKGSFSDDHWIPGALVSFDNAGDTCPDSTTAYTMQIEEVLEDIQAQIPIGAPIRIFELASFWLAAQDGSWFLKSSAQGGQPIVVSGPLAPADSAATSVLQFRYLDADGNTTATLSEIARIEIDLAAVGAVPMRRGGEPLSRNRAIAIKLRNTTP